MTLAYWCIFVAFLLPYVFVSMAKYGPKFNNHAPRDYLEKLHGWRKRAYWTHLNGFEAFAPFAVAVLIAEQSTAQQSTIDGLAVLFVIARLGHAASYIYDKATLRSVVWFVGFGSVIGLFLISAWQ